MAFLFFGLGAFRFSWFPPLSGGRTTLSSFFFFFENAPSYIACRDLSIPSPICLIPPPTNAFAFFFQDGGVFWRFW